MLKIEIKMQKKGKERTKRYKMQQNKMWLEKTHERNKQKWEKNEWMQRGVQQYYGGCAE